MQKEIKDQTLRPTLCIEEGNKRGDPRTETLAFASSLYIHNEGVSEMPFLKEEKRPPNGRCARDRLVRKLVAEYETSQNAEQKAKVAVFCVLVGELNLASAHR